MKRGVYGGSLIKRGAIGLGSFMETVLTSTPGQKIGGVGCLSVEWYETEFDVFVLKDPDYNIIMMSTFLGLTVI